MNGKAIDAIADKKGASRCLSASLPFRKPRFHEPSGCTPQLLAVAFHGWFLLGAGASAAVLCSASLYAKLLSRITSTPDLFKRHAPITLSSGSGGSLENALLLFVVRAFTRNRQQKLIAAFYLGVGSAVLFAVLDQVL